MISIILISIARAYRLSHGVLYNAIQPCRMMYGIVWIWIYFREQFKTLITYNFTFEKNEYFIAVFDLRNISFFKR